MRKMGLLELAMSKIIGAVPRHLYPFCNYMGVVPRSTHIPAGLNLSIYPSSCRIYLSIHLVVLQYPLARITCR